MKKSCANFGFEHSELKGSIHTMVVQLSKLYGMETAPVTSSHVKKLEVTDNKMIVYIGMRPHTKRSLRNDDIREIMNVENITESCRKARSR